jgi:hypothetical protein
MSGQRDKGIVDSAQNAVRQATGPLRGKQPWHSPDSDVYHNNPNCQTGNSIEAENVRQGTGNKRLCGECERLSSAGGPVGNLTGL